MEADRPGGITASGLEWVEATIGQGATSLRVFIQQMVNGLALGSIYALVALGFSMVYGLLFFINLPHGEVMMVGTYVALALLEAQVPTVAAVVAAMLITALLGVVIEKLAYSRLRKARRLAPLLSALGLVLILQNIVLVIRGPQSERFPQIFGAHVYEILGVRLPGTVFFAIGIAIGLMLLLQVFSKKTLLGISIRAASQDGDAAQLVGINPNTVISVTFAIGSALAAAGGILLGARYGAISPTFGFPVMLKAFAASVLGGIGNIPGAVLGGFIIGVAEVMAAAYISQSSQDIVAFGVLILILLLRPSGLLSGRTEVAI